MVSYKQLGLVNTRGMFKKAMAGKYAIPAYNFNNMEQLQAIIQGCINSRSPVILQVSKGARKYANQVLLQYMAQGAMEVIKASGVPVPVALHLDHGDSYELCVSCIDSGFSSVMIDGSALPYEKNVELTKRVVEYAHARDVTVEGELGVLAGIEDEVHAETSHYTNPDDVEDFVKKTGVDSLAISIGTSHPCSSRLTKSRVAASASLPASVSASWRSVSTCERNAVMAGTARRWARRSAKAASSASMIRHASAEAASRVALPASAARSRSPRS